MNYYDATVMSYSASSTICAKEIFWSCGSWTAYRAVPPEIGEVLRHKSPDTTAIYAKVELNALRPLALPRLGGVK
jgi:hypothetical protein